MVPGIVYKVFTAGLEISHYDHRNVNRLGIASAETLGNLPQYTPPRFLHLPPSSSSYHRIPPTTLPMAPSFDFTALQALKDALTSSIVVTPDSEGYQDSLRRWSETGIKPAV